MIEAAALASLAGSAQPLAGVAQPLALAAGACAVLLYPDRSPVRRRRGRGQGQTKQQRSAVPRQIAFPVAGVAAALLLAGAAWWLVLMSTAAAGYVVVRLRRRNKPLRVHEMRSIAAALDIFAACLDAGLSTASALGASVGSTGRASRGHDTLAQAAAMLALGGDAGEAWRPVTRIPALAGLATAAQRSAAGGLRLADAARETAASLRTACRAAVTDRAARTGIAVTAPLALCFLPAFMCLGLAPTVIGMVTSLHLW